MNNNNQSNFIGSLIKVIPTLAGIVAIIIGVYIGVNRPVTELQKQTALIEQRLDVIQNNELQHITDEIIELKRYAEDNREMIIENQKILERILTILEQSK